MRIYIIIALLVAFGLFLEIVKQQDFLAKHNCKLVHLNYGLLSKNVYQCDGNLTVKSVIRTLN
ncbi:hypothetical protein [Paralysiella testudinis]|uniref:Uncharacterized protein n=1 Tax=Paralysiella testudinis TaxID=2809020 RepID=A0A892ZIK9_9NEIS|nr:hypothetical protein [Paralysiella testudinis]QRQ83041.1 hypothetical protein JQU52_06685 [Paralysiella testudinis]